MEHTRITIINELIRRHGYRNYLEIGVGNGKCFAAIHAHSPVGVDPVLQIRRRYRRAMRRRDFPRLWKRRLLEKTSDDFFAEDAHGLYGERNLDIAFIDGLHTYEQSRRDVLQALGFLQPDGAIVIHDCNPANAAAAHPARDLEHAHSLELPGFVGEWCGEVWKTLVELRAERTDLEVYVLDCDYGVGLVRRGAATSSVDLGGRGVAGLTYRDLEEHRREWLDLRDPDEWFTEIGAPLGRGQRRARRPCAQPTNPSG